MEGETINPDNQEGTTKIILQLPAAPDMNHKSRGVRKGTKRGGYKKTTEHIEEATYVNDESTQKLDEFNNENIQYEEVFAEQPTF